MVKDLTCADGQMNAAICTQKPFEIEKLARSRNSEKVNLI